MPNPSPEEIKSRVKYHPPTDQAIACHSAVRNVVEDAMAGMSLCLPESREASLVMTKLEEAMFWANSAIARNHDKL